MNINVETGKFSQAEWTCVTSTQIKKQNITSTKQWTLLGELNVNLQFVLYWIFWTYSGA